MGKGVWVVENSRLKLPLQMPGIAVPQGVDQTRREAQAGREGRKGR